MKIRKLGLKMFLGFGSVLALVAILIVVAISKTQQTISQYDGLIETEIKMRDLAREVNIHMLEARRSEKDFLMEFETEDGERALEQAKLIGARAADIRDIAVPAGFKQGEELATEIAGIATEYETMLSSVVAAYTSMGLNDTSGLRGEINVLSDEWTALLRQLDVDDPYTQFLLLRRWEKDFAMEQGATTRDRAHTALEAYANAIAESGLANERKQFQAERVSAYRDKFTAYASSGGDVALYSELREIAGAMEDNLNEAAVRRASVHRYRILTAEKEYLRSGEEAQADLAREQIARLRADIDASTVLPEYRDRMTELLT